MEFDKFQLSDGCWFEYLDSEISVNYIERSFEIGYLDTETDIGIERDELVRLIQWLVDKLGRAQGVTR